MEGQRKLGGTRIYHLICLLTCQWLSRSASLHIFDRFVSLSVIRSVCWSASHPTGLFSWQLAYRSVRTQVFLQLLACKSTTDLLACH